MSNQIEVLDNVMPPPVDTLRLTAQSGRRERGSPVSLAAGPGGLKARPSGVVPAPFTVVWWRIHGVLSPGAMKTSPAGWRVKHESCS